jgi:hypothetical protein
MVKLYQLGYGILAAGVIMLGINEIRGCRTKQKLQNKPVQESPLSGTFQRIRDYSTNTQSQLEQMNGSLSESLTAIENLRREQNKFIEGRW